MQDERTRFVAAHPSATVMLLRDGASGPEVLLVERAAELDFLGGSWVFPGGRIDSTDFEGAVAAPDDIPLDVLRRAAVRELEEEAGLDLDAGALVWQARWTTPEGFPKRFRTWFFMARAVSTHARVDGGEIRAHRWLAPAAAVDEQRAGRLALPPPTFVTLTQLARFTDVASALAHSAEAGPEEYVPRPRRIEGGFCSLYQQDAAYEGGPLDAPGPRHRLWVVEGGFRYDRAFETS
jgi:8-oxo-dGTP pyrophosphatase MutT (NUDIX family)